jgi:hypothetical protein
MTVVSHCAAPRFDVKHLRIYSEARHEAISSKSSGVSPDVSLWHGVGRLAVAWDNTHELLRFSEKSVKVIIGRIRTHPIDG